MTLDYFETVHSQFSFSKELALNVRMRLYNGLEMVLLALGFMILGTTHQAIAQKWMYLSLVTSPLSPHEDSYKRFGFSAKKSSILSHNDELLQSIIRGCGDALRECQRQMRWRQWNCRIEDKTGNGKSPFGNAVQAGTREKAFVSAIYAASVMHTLTVDCRRGLIKGCSCHKQTSLLEGRKVWNGCHDNIEFGAAVSRGFVDSSEISKEERSLSQQHTLMNLHNNEAGRKIIRENMGAECRCHGTSGSCSMRTCYHVVPSFLHIGRVLKNKFDSAYQVAMTSLGTRQQLLPIYTGSKRLTSSDLIYLDPSPDFCQRNSTTGSFITKGRLCKYGVDNPGSCRRLCCGGKSRPMMQVGSHHCKCRFQWCCKVHCKKCTTKKLIHKCT